MYVVLRSRVAVSGVTPNGASSRQAVSSRLSSAVLSPGRRMNSQRRRPGPLATTVVGLAGSQICTLVGVNSRGRCSSTSQSSHS